MMVNEEHFPSARCRQIHLKIEKREKTNNDLPDAFDFSKFILTTSLLYKKFTLTRSDLLYCCLICEVARFNTMRTSRGTAKAVPYPLGRPPVAAQDFLLPPWLS